MRDGSGVRLISGEQPWDMGVGTGHNQAYQVLVAGNDTNSLVVGHAHNADMEAYPATGTLIEGHTGSNPELRFEEETTIRSATSVRFSPASKLASGDVGPWALEQASQDYLRCRRP